MQKSDRNMYDEMYLCIRELIWINISNGSYETNDEVL